MNLESQSMFRYDGPVRRTNDVLCVVCAVAEFLDRKKRYHTATRLLSAPPPLRQDVVRAILRHLGTSALEHLLFSKVDLRPECSPWNVIVANVSLGPSPTTTPRYRSTSLPRDVRLSEERWYNINFSIRSNILVYLLTRHTSETNRRFARQNLRFIQPLPPPLFSHRRTPATPNPAVAFQQSVLKQDFLGTCSQNFPNQVQD